MVGTTLVKQDLTPEMIQAGAEFIRVLDAAQVPVTSAFWLYHGEEPDWRLVIASPEVVQLGIREFYGKLIDHRRALNRDEVNSSVVTAVAPDDPIVAAVRKVYKLPGIASIRSTGNVFNGILIPDALIYRST
jgi:hypothetical protein